MEVIINGITGERGVIVNRSTSVHFHGAEAEKAIASFSNKVKLVHYDEREPLAIKFSAWYYGDENHGHWEAKLTITLNSPLLKQLRVIGLE